METKFYLNKFVKVDNIEKYSLKSLKELRKCYDKMMEDTEGLDPDFPGIDFGGKKGQKVGGMNKFQVDEALGLHKNNNDIFDEM